MIAALRQFQNQLTRDKADVLLLLGAALTVLVPHFVHLPWWISVFCCLTLLYRASVTFRGKRMPHAWLLLATAVAAMVAVFWSYGKMLGRDSGVAMLVLLVAFKMLEMRARRDLFVVIYLCLFLVLTNFFYSQSIGTAMAMVVSVVMLLTAQATFQYTGAVPPLAQRLKSGGRVVLIAAPLALVLFVAFPRIQGPLWSLPGDAGSGRTGLSDSISPGNLSSLAESYEVAFRVRFHGPRPPQEKLYWRAMVYGQYDGRTWNLGPRVYPAAPRQMIRGGQYRYEITLEPHDKRFLLALDLQRGVPQLRGYVTGVTNEMELMTNRPVTERIRYEAVSHTDVVLLGSANPHYARMWLELPVRGNPLTHGYAEKLRAIAEPADRVNAVLAMFRREPFVYTLDAPPLGRHSVDEFLFKTRTGFCEHYASSFVFLMRAAGVPARVVGGYQGGEINPVDGFLTVRQSDAHAWAEVFLAGRGWVRIDPTAAVAPERVRRSQTRPSSALAPFGLTGLGELLDTSRPSWLTTLRFQLSAINNSWNQWVLNYNPERQQGFLQSLAEAFGNARTLAGAAAIIVLIQLALVLRRQRAEDPGERLYRQLCARLARAGVERAAHEGPTALAARVRAIHMPERHQLAALEFLAAYSAYQYAADRNGPAQVDIMKKCLNEFR